MYSGILEDLLMQNETSLLVAQSLCLSFFPLALPPFCSGHVYFLTWKRDFSIRGAMLEISELWAAPIFSASQLPLQQDSFISIVIRKHSLQSTQGWHASPYFRCAPLAQRQFSLLKFILLLHIAAVTSAARSLPRFYRFSLRNPCRPISERFTLLCCLFYAQVSPPFCLFVRLHQI
jgi:hypothetical protein